MSSAISDLLANRCIKEITHKPYICSPLSVVTNSLGKLCLVLNLRYLNQYLLKDNLSTKTSEQLCKCLKQITTCLLLTLNQVITMWIFTSNIGNTWGFPGARYLTMVLCLLCPPSHSLFCVYQIVMPLSKALEKSGVKNNSLPG